MFQVLVTASLRIDIESRHEIIIEPVTPARISSLAGEGTFSILKVFVPITIIYISVGVIVKAAT